jgi:hypothetical protein
MEEMQKRLFSRCGCCDISFQTKEECRRHFESVEHKIVAYPAFIRFWAGLFSEKGERNARRSMDENKGNFD